MKSRLLIPFYPGCLFLTVPLLWKGRCFLKVVAGSSSSALGYDSVIKNFKYTDEGDLYISDPLGIIHLKRKPDRSFEAVKIYKI